jgi:glycosyltransferase involved in cell wall biosynthesis
MSAGPKPIISVIIPTKNRVGMTLRAIDSVLRQSFTDFELIIVDDGSHEDQRTQLEKLISLENDNRLQFYTSEPKGVSHARNLGVEKSKADWICFLDSDDVWKKHKLSEQIRYHMAHPDCLISQTDDNWIRNSSFANKGKLHKNREGDIFEASLRLCLICCSSVMVKKDFFLKHGGFDENLPTCEDYDLWLKILSETPVGFVNKKLVTKFGGHTDQLSKHFEAMDQYRIQSLENILSSPLELSEKQVKAIQKELQRKKEIFESGQKKRSAKITH